MKKKTYYLFLTGRGFGSEFLNLVYFYYYCNKNNYNLKIISKYWNFTYKKGWEDYFYLPYGQKEPESIRFKIIYFFAPKFFFPPKYHKMQKLILIIQKIYYYLNRLKITNFIFTPYIMPFNTVNFTRIRKLVLNDAINNQELFKKSINKIINEIWKINTEFLEILSKRARIYEKYIAFHIRRGDKVGDEDIKYTPKNYKEILDKLNLNINLIYLITDDYKAFVEFKEEFKNFTLITNCTENMQGHSQLTFNKITPEEKRLNMLNLLYDIEVAKSSYVFIGSINSNIYKLVDYFKEGERCYDISSINGDYKKLQGI